MFLPLLRNRKGIGSVSNGSCMGKGSKTVSRLYVLLIGLVPLPFVSAAHADEYYEFFSIRCAPTAQFMSIDSVGIWNIGEVVWPPSDAEKLSRQDFISASWRAHEEGLKRLEAEGLYVFGEAFGRYDPQPVTCSTAAYTATFSADPVERVYGGSDDIKVQYRGELQVKISLPDGRVVWDQVLPKPHSLHIDRDEITLCRSRSDVTAEVQRNECTKISLWSLRNDSKR